MICGLNFLQVLLVGHNRGYPDCLYQLLNRTKVLDFFDNFFKGVPSAADCQDIAWFDITIPDSSGSGLNSFEAILERQPTRSIDFPKS